MILSLFIDVKSIEVISGFNLKRMKKMPDSGVVQKFQKQIWKQRYLLWQAPRSAKCVKNSEDQTKDHSGKLECQDSAQIKWNLNKPS